MSVLVSFSLTGMYLQHIFISSRVLLSKYFIGFSSISLAKLNINVVALSELHVFNEVLLIIVFQKEKKDLSTL